LKDGGTVTLSGVDNQSVGLPYNN